MTGLLRADGLGKRYGSRWALSGCTIDIDEGQVVALVGPNGAGKSTFLELAVGLLAPTAGRIEILGASPTAQPAAVLPHVGFVAQDHPLYRGFSVEEMLRFGRAMNPTFDQAFALSRVRELDLPLSKKVGQLSGGQQAQIALVLALAKRPRLLLLDEPIAAFDPLARREFLQLLMETVAETGTAVVLSSHILGDLERVCDSLLLLAGSRVHLAGSIDDLLSSHRFVVGPVEQEMLTSHLHEVIQVRRSERQVATLVHLDAPLVLGDAWVAKEPTLEDIVLAYLEGQRAVPSVAA